jgi:hypothetical protein
VAHAILRSEQIIFLTQKKEKKCLVDSSVFKEVKEIQELNYYLY